MESKKRSVRHQTELILSVNTNEFKQGKIRAEYEKKLSPEDQEAIMREKARITEETLWKKA